MKNNQKTGNQNSRIEGKPNVAAFTLIELLVVISIIALLAAFIVPIMSTLKRKEYINKTQAEMAQIETAIESYKAAYGFYPPSNSTNFLVNQLYYELVGTTNTTTATTPGSFVTLDGSSQIGVSQVHAAFGGGTPGVNGFLNCSKLGAGEDAPVAKTFLPDLKASQIFRQYTNSGSLVGVDLLIGSLNGPDQFYQPLNTTPNNIPGNPWRYNSSNPTNNPGSYDLWIQLSIGSSFSSSSPMNNFTNPRKYLICNWTKQVQVNSPLP